MMNLQVGIGWYFFIVLIAKCAVSQYAGQCLSDQWPPKSDLNIPIYVVNLDASPLVRWKEIAIVYKSQVIKIKDLLEYTKTFIARTWPALAFLIDLTHTKLPSIVDTLPKPYGDELRGISEASGISLGEIVLYNIFYELSSLCTSIIAQDEDGNVFHGRNLDLGLFLGWNEMNKTWAMTHLLRPLVITVNYTKDGQVHFRTTGFAGFIGALTGIKPGIFSITLNTRFDLQGGYIGIIEWLYNLDRQQSFVTLAMRDMLTNAGTYDEAVEYLSEIPLLAPCYYILSGSQSNQGVILTRSRKESIDITRLKDDHRWFLIQTNHDHWQKQPDFDDRLTPAIKCMQSKGRSNITFATFFNLLSSRPMLNKLTIYTSLLQSKTDRLESYLQSCNDKDAPCTLW